MTRKPGIPGPKPGANPGKKRKQDKDLSKNPHTMRGRELLASKSDSEKAVIRRKNNDRAAFVSARLKLRASTSWQEATMEEQEILENSLKDQVMRERYVNLAVNLAITLIFDTDMKRASQPNFSWISWKERALTVVSGRLWILKMIQNCVIMHSWMILLLMRPFRPLRLPRKLKRHNHQLQDS